jgi:hypothetical protein
MKTQRLLHVRFGALDIIIQEVYEISKWASRVYGIEYSI